MVLDTNVVVLSLLIRMIRHYYDFGSHIGSHLGFRGVHTIATIV